MRVLCVGRHAYLSEHLCRYFSELGTQCEAVIGAAGVPAAAARFEPNAVVCDSDLLTPALMDAWGREPAMAGAAVLAVSLTRRPDETVSPMPDAGVIYLPGLEREQVLALLTAAYRPLGVQSPVDWQIAPPPPATVR
jgi:hypothetical protein